MELKTPYAFGKSVDMPYAETERRVREELAKEGFGIITEIDFRKKFAEKLQKEFRNYIILGACNPSLAYEALGDEINLGALLPCNVIVYATDDGRTAIMVMDPVEAFAMIGNPKVREQASIVAEKMKRVLAAIP
jgi:uncharacterized protein (DUF302 family)